MYKNVALVLLILALAPALAFGQVTFSRDVAPVIYAKCARCHRPDGSAPFSLLTYRDARSHATQIALVTKNRVMPPWKADPTGEKFIGLDPLTQPDQHHRQRQADSCGRAGYQAELRVRLRSRHRRAGMAD